MYQSLLKKHPENTLLYKTRKTLYFTKTGKHSTLQNPENTLLYKTRKTLYFTKHGKHSTLQNPENILLYKTRKTLYFTKQTNSKQAIKRTFSQTVTHIPLTETLRDHYRNQTHVGNLTKIRFTACLKLPCLNHFLYLMENVMNNVMA